MTTATWWQARRSASMPAFIQGRRQAVTSMPDTCDVAWCTCPLNPLMDVLNNTWGAGTATGSQRITVASEHAWSTTFNWARPDEWQVTSYPAAILGWHWGVAHPGSGLPVPLHGSPTKVVGTTRFTMTPPDASTCRYDVMYDLWAHPMPQPKDDGTDPRFELMIWLAYSQDYLGVGAPYLAERPVLGGLRWKVLPLTIGHPGNGGQTDTVAFMIDGPNVWDATLNVMDFYAWMLTRRSLFPPSPMLDQLHTWFLTGVQFGTEAYNGQGTLDVSYYDVRVETAPPPEPEPEPPPPPEISRRDFYRGQAIAGAAISNYSVTARKAIRQRAELWADEMTADGP
jgi:hypothetical protein